MKQYKEWNMSDYRAVFQMRLCLWVSRWWSFYTQSNVWNAKASANSMFTLNSEPQIFIGVDLEICSWESLERQNWTKHWAESRILVLLTFLYMVLTQSCESFPTNL